jgi:hypothetical protein
VAARRHLRGLRLGGFRTASLALMDGYPPFRLGNHREGCCALYCVPAKVYRTSEPAVVAAPSHRTDLPGTHRQLEPEQPIEQPKDRSSMDRCARWRTLLARRLAVDVLLATRNAQLTG